MTSREHLAADIDRINTVIRRIGFGVWAVAAFVMIYGVPVAFGPLKDHGVPAGVAWMPSLAADAAMCVAIVAGPVLATYNIRAGWIGILRWSAAFTTWALQTAGSWLAPSGPDLAGVGLHSLPPALLFAVGEGAAYFVRKMSNELTTKRRELAAAEQKDADRRAHLAETEANLRAAQAEAKALAAERDGHLRDIERLTSEAAELRTTITTVEADRDNLRDSRDRDVQAATADLAEENRTLRRDLRQARAEAGTINLDAHRRNHGGGGKSTSAKTTAKGRLSDEDAVQMLLDAPPHPDKDLPAGHLREWTQSAIVTHLGVGWGKAPRLLEAVTEAQQRLGSDGAAVGE